MIDARPEGATATGLAADRVAAGTPSSRYRRRLAIALGLTASYLIAEVVGGVLTRSLALLADAGHMLTDAGGIALALFAIRFASRPPTPDRTYGFYRAEILAALANAVVLVGISLYILYEAYVRFLKPPRVASGPMLVVAGIGLVVNLASVRILRGGAGESLNIRGAYFEVLSDTLSSAGVIAAGVVMLATGWYYADPIVSALIGLFILPRTWRLLREVTGILLEGTPPEVKLDDVRRTIAAVPGVAGVHDLHVWSLTSGANALSAHVVLAEGNYYAAILSAVDEAVRGQHPILHVTVQVEPAGWENGATHL